MKIILVIVTSVLLCGCSGLGSPKENPVRGGYILTDQYSCEAEMTSDVGKFKANEYSLSWEGKLDSGVTAEIDVGASIRIKSEVVSWAQRPYMFINFQKAEESLPDGMFAAALLSDSGAVFSGAGESRLPYTSAKVFYYEGKDLAHVLEDTSDVELYIFSDKRAVIRSQRISRNLLLEVFKGLQQVFQKNIENMKNEKEKCVREGVMVGMNDRNWHNLHGRLG